MPSPWRSSPGASTHLPQLRLLPPPLAHLSLPHHRPPPRRLPISLVLLPPGRAGLGGRGGRRGRGGGDCGGCGTPTQALTPPLAPLPGGAPWLTFSNTWSGRITMWPHQGQGGGPRPPHQSTDMVASTAFYASTWTPPPPPSLSWPGWDQATLAQSFTTVGLTPPVGTEWIADSGASYHTTPDAGILSSIRPPHPSCPSIMVGDGSCLPITSVGSAHGVSLMSLLLLRWSTISFLFVNLQLTILVLWSDTSSLSVKDLATGRPLLRCDSTGPLWTTHSGGQDIPRHPFPVVGWRKTACSGGPAGGRGNVVGPGILWIRGI
jgi:hypothetical protein